MEIKPPLSQTPIVQTNDPAEIEGPVNKNAEQKGNTETASNTQTSPAAAHAMKQAGTELKGTMKTGEHLMQQALSDQLGRSTQLQGWPESQGKNAIPLFGSQVITAQAQNASGTTSTSGPNATGQATTTKMDEARKHFDKGQAAFQAGKYHEALEAFNKADALYPHPDFKYNQGACLEKLGKRELAAQKYEAYLAEKPNAPDAATVRTQITKLHEDALKASQSAFDRGRAAYDAGNFKEAAAAFTEAYEHKPQPEILYNIGAAYQRGGDTKQAIKHYQLYLNNHPDAKDADKVRSQIHKLQKKTGDELMQPDPLKAGQVAFDRGRAAYDAGRFKEAAAAFTEAYEHHPQPEILYNIGAAYQQAGDTKQAIKHYQLYLNNHPDAKDADKVRSHIHRLQKKTGDELMQPDPLKAAQTAFDRGKSAFSAGRFKEAAAAFTEAYEHHPQPDILYNIGAAYQQAGDPKQAIKHYQLYLNNHPDAKDADKVRNHIRKLQAKTGDGLMQPGAP